MQLERQILGVEREGDLPGEMIPYVYFEFLRSGEAQRLVPIFHHNAIDILTLACLTAIVPSAFRSTDPESLRALGVRRGEEFLGIGRWLLAARKYERGLALLKRAIDSGLPEALLFRTLWDVARLERRLNRPHAAINLMTELAGCSNPHRIDALEELAKHYEHVERNYALALEFTNEALTHSELPALQHRAKRLKTKLAKPRSRRLLPA